MKVLILTVVCAFTIFDFINADVAIALPNPQRKPGGCYEDDVGHLVKAQTVTVPGKCYSAFCNSEGGINYTGCGKILTSDPHCHVTKEDLSKPHPDCCPHVKCHKKQN